MTEKVNHPSHYRSDTGHEAIDVIEAWELNFSLGNVIKYVCRAGLKGTGPESKLEDLEKALHYLRREVGRLQLEKDLSNAMELLPPEMPSSLVTLPREPREKADRAKAPDPIRDPILGPCRLN